MNNLSVIIPVSRSDTIYNCLNSLIKNNLGALQTEIIIVENPEITINKDIIGHLPQQISLIIKKSRVNHPSAMRNLGADGSTGEFLVFIDDDVIVSKNWLKNIYQILIKNPEEIICGPNVDISDNFSYSLSNTIQSLYVSEGLKSHAIQKDKIKIDHHNIPLNNCAFKKEIFGKIKGFNEKVDYYLDDVEFFYICHKLGYIFFQYPELTIQHHSRKFPFDFLKYKFFARKKIGYNAFFFPELYSETAAIKIVLLTYFLIPAFVLFFFLFPRYFPWITILIFLIYSIILIFYSLKTIIESKNWKYAILPIGIFLTHIANYSGFTCGLISGLINLKDYKKIIAIKKKRYAVFSD